MRIAPVFRVVLPALVAALAAGCMTMNGAAPPEVPATLQPPAEQRLLLPVRANGVQIYECSASKDDAHRFEWTFKAPEAELSNDAGARVGRHYGGPTWEASDGSKVTGVVKGRDDGPDPNAIPWLLLTAKSTSGIGILGKAASIQRVATVGGKAPPEPCTDAQVGSEVRVPYRASYYFYGS